MKKFAGILAVMAIFAMCFCNAGHAFVFGNPSGCAVAPYEVTVQYTPIQPQAGECTYCACLPYGCPDGAPVVNSGVPCGSCGGCGTCGVSGCVGGVCGLVGCIGSSSCCGVVTLGSGIVCDTKTLVCNATGNVFDLVIGVLSCFNCNGCSQCAAATVAE